MLSSLVPETFYQDLAEWILWLIAPGAIALLVVGADKAVSAAAKLASMLGMSKVLIGATVVSLGTTSPEAAVSVASAIGGKPGLALGNGVGSIICDTALIFGLCCCLKRLPKDRFILNRHGWLQFGAGALLFATALVLWAFSGDIDNVVMGRGVGTFYLALLAGYMYLSVRWSRMRPAEPLPHGEILPDGEILPHGNAPEPPARPGPSSVLASLGWLAVGLALVVSGSDVLIGSVTEVCHRHAVPEAVIAGTLVAFGTSLPELVTAIAAILKGHPELLVGNIVGADILNVLFVVGASAAATPLKVDPIFFQFMLPTMIAVLLLMRFYIFLPGDRFQRWQGVPLLAAYAAYLAMSLKFGMVGHE